MRVKKEMRIHIDKTNSIRDKNNSLMSLQGSLGSGVTKTRLSTLMTYRYSIYKTE